MQSQLATSGRQGAGIHDELPTCPPLRAVHLSTLNQHDRAFVLMATLDGIVNQGHHNCGHKYGHRPVEAFRRDRILLRPKGPEKAPGDNKDGHGIDGDAQLSERKVRVRERLRVVDAAPEHAADGEAEALHDGAGQQRTDGIQRHRAANVNEAQERRDGSRQVVGVDRDLALLVHRGQPRGARQAPVARKGKQVTAHGRQVRKVGEEQEDALHNQQRRKPRVRHGLLEDPDGGIHGRFRQRDLDVGDVVAERDDGHDVEEKVDPKHANHDFRHRRRRVAHLLRHVGGGVHARLRRDGGQLADEHGDGQARPAARVFPPRPDVLRGGARRVAPDGDEKGKVGEDVDGEDGVLPVRQDLGAVHVGDDREAADGDGEERAVPVFEGVVGLVDLDDGLHQRADEEQAGCVAGLEREGRGPATEPHRFVSHHRRGEGVRAAAGADDVFSHPVR